MSNLLRTIGQSLQGRTNTKNEQLDFVQVQKLLSSLYVPTPVTVKYAPAIARKEHSSVRIELPADAKEFVQREFNPGQSFIRYCKGEHQVFTHKNNQTEKHYLELTVGNLSGIDGSGNYQFTDDKKAILSFFQEINPNAI